MSEASERPRAVVVGPHFPYPPTSGGVKRTLRILEAIERAGAHVHFLTFERADPAAVSALSARGWHMQVIPDDLDRPSDRLHQHIHRLATRHSHRLAAAIRTTCASGPTAFLQVEGNPDSNYLLSTQGVPKILSTQNADAAMARSLATSMPSASIARLRAEYHAYRFARAERRAGAAADAILCVSPQDAANFRRLSDNVIIAPNGIDDALFAVDDVLPDNEDVLFFGQLLYEPNLEGITRFIAEGWPHFAEKRPRGRLLIAGEGSRELLGDRTVDPRIQILGLVDNIAAAVARARIILVPIWRGGGTRIKVLEGLAAARPVVGTSLGVSGIGFEHGVHGLVADDAVALAQAAVELCANDERSARLAAAGRELARDYRWDRALAPAETLFRE
jgi:polysaccharide biosynthesis protein PslH